MLSVLSLLSEKAAKSLGALLLPALFMGLTLLAAPSSAAEPLFSDGLSSDGPDDLDFLAPDDLPKKPLLRLAYAAETRGELRPCPT